MCLVGKCERLINKEQGETGMSELELGLYQHHKGKFYEVIGQAIHSETREEMVIYKALYDDPKYGKDSIWVRPKKMFLEEVVLGDGTKAPRFKHIPNFSEKG